MKIIDNSCELPGSFPNYRFGVREKTKVLAWSEPINLTKMKGFLIGLEIRFSTKSNSKLPD